MEESDKQKGARREIPIRVEDRRFWARGEEADGDPTAAAGPRAPTYVEELEASLEDARRRVQESADAYRRGQAEFDEARARLSRDVDVRVRQAKAELFRKLVGIADDMDRAVAAAAGSAGEEGLTEGMGRIHAGFMNVLQAEGVERIEVLDAPFDPETAEAVGVVPVEEDRHDLVVEELRPGYRLGEITLRPAQVQVGRRRD